MINIQFTPKQIKSKSLENVQMVLITPKRYLAQMVNQSDMNYFSKPVRVNIVRTDDDGLVWVNDPARHVTFPTNRANLTREIHLTNRQKSELEEI